MNKGEIILYNDKPNLEIRLENNTIWLNQKQMAEILGTIYLFTLKNKVLFRTWELCFF